MDLSQKQMEQLRLMLAQQQGGTGLLGLDTPREMEPARWMQDLYAKQNYQPMLSPIVEETQAAPTTLTNEEAMGNPYAGTYYGTQEPVRTGTAPAFERDNELWEMQRALQGGLSAWGGMADLANMEGGRYNKRTNPYDLIVEGYEDPSYYDMYYTGTRQLTPEALEAIRAAGGTGGLEDVMYQDVTALLDAFTDEGWNPFYGDENQAIIDRKRELGLIDDRPTAYESRIENNALDYLYRNFSDGMDSATRNAVIDKWNQYLHDTGTTSRDYYGRRMTERMFNEIGLNELADFNADYNTGPLGANPLADFMGGGTGNTYTGNFVEARNKALGLPPINPAETGPAGAAYAEQKEEQSKKFSVASLFDEMKNWKKEDDPAKADVRNKLGMMKVNHGGKTGIWNG